MDPRRWRCVRCGHLPLTERPPVRCPDCGAPRLEFVRVTIPAPRFGPFLLVE
jgi:rubrerythrin